VAPGFAACRPTAGRAVGVGLASIRLGDVVVPGVRSGDGSVMLTDIPSSSPTGSGPWGVKTRSRR
jgi:hypothetical protein